MTSGGGDQMQQRPLPAPAGSPASMILMRITMARIMVRITMVIMIWIICIHDSDKDHHG